MKYDYMCEDEECKTITEVDLPLADDKPESVKCSKCGKKAYRYWKSSNLILPENFKAMGDAAPWDNRYGKFPKGTRGKYTRGGGVK